MKAEQKQEILKQMNNVRFLFSKFIIETYGKNDAVFDIFNEEDHPRREDGKFGSGGGKGSEENKSGKGAEPFGKAYKEYSHKPEKAIEYLLEVKNGHVPGAINKEGIGDIDFVWGETGADTGTEGYGLAHIIQRRNEEGKNGKEFVKQLPSLIREGEINDKHKHFGRLYIQTKEREAMIRLDWDRKEKIWLATAYIKK